jgi:hypothetical protein
MILKTNHTPDAFNMGKTIPSLSGVILKKCAKAKVDITRSDKAYVVLIENSAKNLFFLPLEWAK